MTRIRDSLEVQGWKYVYLFIFMNDAQHACSIPPSHTHTHAHTDTCNNKADNYDGSTE